MSDKNKAILVVSFGTSFPETREKTIDVIEKTIEKNYTDYRIYRAWTSKMIIKKIWTRDHIKINTVTEACKQMLLDGITELIVQPTHVINGIENDQMKEDVLGFKNQFSKISFGNPLLSSTDDQKYVIQSLMRDFNFLDKEDALVFMGHGTTHHANTIYAAVDYMLKDMGYKNVFLGTVESYPSMESIQRKLKDYKPKKVYLAPFMIVAGDHATKDMAGEHKDSWKYQFEQEGYDISCIMKGLGEYAGIRELFLSHIKEAESI